MTECRVRAALGCDVQFFASHRVVEAHGWALASQGQLVRRFSYLGEAGEVQANLGELTEGERSDRLAAAAVQLPVGPVDFDDEALELPDEDTVLAVARAWSLDPTALDGKDDRQGLLGRLG